MENFDLPLLHIHSAVIWGLQFHIDIEFLQHQRILQNPTNSSSRRTLVDTLRRLRMNGSIAQLARVHGKL